MLSQDVFSSPYLSIAIGNTTFGDAMIQYVQEVEVEEIGEKLSTAKVTVVDVDRAWLRDDNIKKGASITIRMGFRKSSRINFRGKITFMEAKYPQEGFPSLILTCLDTAYQPFEVRHTRVFRSQTVSNVVKKMIEECGFIALVDDTGTVLESIPQRDESNREFINRWKDALGWYFNKTQSGQYYFGKNATGVPIDTLSYKKGGFEILSFDPVFQDLEETE